jgi:serine/threonine-protein kinase
MDPRPRTLGPFRLVRRLGAGGMAEVWLATAFGASGFEKKVALKTLLPGLVGDGDAERVLLEEAKLAARLSHRGVVQVHDLGVADGVVWVRQEWVDGESVETLLRKRPPSPEVALLVAEEIAAALDYVHAATDDAGRPLGLVHRDVSPSNVLVSRAGEVKLADFGIAKATLLREVTRGGVRKGKWAYLSPEQAAGLPLGPASDQFSLGILLYELLAGRRPFDADSVAETIDRIREAVPPDLTPIPPSAAPILERCFARLPADRYPSAEGLRSAIAAARASLPSAGPREVAAWLASS